MKSTFNNVGVVGVGAMGQGIAQMAAQAGAQVRLFDTQAPAVQKAIQAITQQWQKMLEKGRISSDTCATYSARLHACGSLSCAAMAVTDKEDVLVANTADAGTRASSWANNSFFTARFSTMASMTKSQADN